MANNTIIDQGIMAVAAVSANVITKEVVTRRVVEDVDNLVAESERITEEAKTIGAEAQKQAEYAKAQGEYAKEEGDKTAAYIEQSKAEFAGFVTSATAMATAESGRVSAEASRVSAENTRKTNENARVSAESGRVMAEQGRVTAEQSRVNAEQNREAARELTEAATSRANAATTNANNAASNANEKANYAKQQADIVADSLVLADIVTEEYGSETMEAIKASGVEKFVKVTEQDFTDKEKEQARINIGANDCFVIGANGDKIPQSFIDIWNRWCTYSYAGGGSNISIGKYNSNTGYFELNTVTDLTYADAIEIFSVGKKQVCSASSFVYASNIKIRTNPPNPYTWTSVDYGSMAFTGCAALEVVLTNPPLAVKDATFGYFEDCKKLKKIYGSQGLYIDTTAAKCFKNCVALEEVKFYQTNRNQVDLQWSPNLKPITIKNFINQAKIFYNPCELRVHPDVYAKLTSEESGWEGLIEQALGKGVNITTV